MRKLLFLPLLLLAECGYKAPPPGKLEFQGPGVKILSPQPSDTVRDTACVVFRASDPSKVGKTVLYVEGSRVAELEIARPDTAVIGTLCFDSKAYYDGQLRIFVSAYDLWDNQANSDTIIVYASNGRKAEGEVIDTLTPQGPAPAPRRR